MITPRSPSRKLYRRRQSCPGNYDVCDYDDVFVIDDDDDENDHINDFYNYYHYLFLSS